MNKSQLIDALAARYDGNKKAAAHALESVLDTITREVARGEKVAITGFGSFEKRLRPARWVRNPRTGERMKSKKTFVPRFSAGADLRNVVSGVKKLPKLNLDAARAAASMASAPVKAAAAKAAPAKVTPPAKAAASPAASRAASDSGAAAPAAKKTATTKSAPAKKTAAKKTATKKTATKKAPATPTDSPTDS